MALDSETIRLILDLAQSSRDAKDFREKLDAMGEAAESAGRKTDRAAGSTRNLGRAGLETGRVIQDFAQGGIGGILNNLEGLSMALGGGAGLAGLLTGVGVAAFLAMKPIGQFIKALIDGSNDLPAAADRLDRLTGRIKENADQIKELREKQSLTNTELATYNRLLDDQITLEKAANTERERRNTLEALRKKFDGGEKSREAADVAEFATKEAGGVDAVVKEIYADLFGRSEKTGAVKDAKDAIKAAAENRRKRQDELDRLLPLDGPAKENAKAGNEKLFQEEYKAAQEKYDAAISALGKQAADTLNDALAGDLDATQKIVDSGVSNGLTWFQGTRRGIAMADAADRESEEFAERARRGSRRRAADRKATADADALQAEHLAEYNAATTTRDYKLGELQRQADERAEAEAKARPAKDAAAARRNQAATAKAAELNQLRGLASGIDQMTGGSLSVGDLEAAARAAAADMKRNNLSAEAAAMRAIQQVVQNQSAIAQDLARIQANWGQIQAGAQTVGTRLNRAR